MDKVRIARRVTTFIVASSVGFTVARIITVNCPVTKPHQKVQVFIAGYVIGTMLSFKAEQWAGEQFDELSDAILSITTSSKPQPTE